MSKKSLDRLNTEIDKLKKEKEDEVYYFKSSTWFTDDISK